MKTCKRYFKSALSIQDEYSESIHDACHVYMSALYYVSGTNQEKTTKHILKAENGTSTRKFLETTNSELFQPAFRRHGSARMWVLLFIHTMFCKIRINLSRQKMDSL